MHMQIRCLCTTTRLQSQLGRIVHKVMNSGVTKKNRDKNPNALRIPLGLPTAFNKLQKTHNTKRINILNKIFMKNITDLMSTGEVAPSLVGRGIEVTHVSITPDFTVLNVFWIAQNKEDANTNTEEILRIAGGHLQHELSQLKVIGKVPIINFVKNKQYNNIKEVERRLATVDFGEDFVPTAHVISENKAPILRTSVSEKIKQQLEKLKSESETSNNNNEIEEDDDTYEIQLPEMRQNVMGFDHEYVLTKIQLSISKLKIAEERQRMGVPEFPKGSEEIPEVSSFLSTSKNEVDIDSFIKQRLSDEKRRKKALPLREAKLEAETEWSEQMDNENVNELYIPDEYQEDDYRNKEF